MAKRFSVEAVFKTVDRITAPVTRMQNRVRKFTRSMERGFARANRSLSRMLSRMRRGAVTVAKFGAITIGGLTASVGLLIREFSKIENAEAAFTPLLGGAKAAKKLVEELNTAAASTPFQFETLAGAASQLLPVMNGDIQNTIKTIKMLGDTAGGNAQKLDSITRGFTKAMLKGKVDMESLNMIAEAGVPIFTELAESMGVKVNAAFFKMISAGKVGTRDLTKAFEKMTSKGGVFFKGMEIASKTTSGIFSTLKDNISLTAAELGSVLAPVIKDLLRNMITIAKRGREWVKVNRELINERFLEFVESIKKVLKGVGTTFRFLSRHGATIAKVIAAVVALSLALKTVGVVMGVINLLMMANPLGLFAVAIAGVAALIIANWEPLSGFFTDLWDGIVLTVSDAFTKIMGWIDSSIQAVKDFGDSVSEFFTFGDDEGGGGGLPERFGRTSPDVVSPQERTARSIEENRTTSTAEVTIKDETGRAEVSGGALGAGITLQPSGAF